MSKRFEISAPLAVVRPFYNEYPPTPDLRAFVACTWVRVVGHLERSGLFPVIPDGCVDVLTYDNAPPHVAGPATRTHWIELTPGTIIAGLRLRPGAARTILRCVARDLDDRDTPLNDLDRRRTKVLLDRLQESTDVAAKRLALECWARSRIEEYGRRDIPLVGAARILALDPRHSLDGIGESLGWGPRRLHREFIATCGYGPKMLQRIMRIQSAIRLARISDSPPQLAELAAATGYADQAHMTRDFRALTDFSPGAYFASNSHEAGQWIAQFG